MLRRVTQFKMGMLCGRLMKFSMSFRLHSQRILVKIVMSNRFLQRERGRIELIEKFHSSALCSFEERATLDKARYVGQ